jgi:FAD/FMN-containing dehydrogenase
VKRRDLIKTGISLPFLAGRFSVEQAAAASKLSRRGFASRVRPGNPNWPLPVEWDRLKQQVGGRLLIPRSPFASCLSEPNNESCREALRQLKNPFYIGDEVALTQTSGWIDAWRSQPSAYAVAAVTTADVVAAVNFARIHNLRLVVKGGGHSYQGTSQAPDSLLIWTRHMNAIELHEAFVGQGCRSSQTPQPAVTVQAGALWIDAYNAVTTQGGRYVQGGGCTSVGVAGLVQSGGFGSFSKNYGCASAGLLEAEMVTADGEVRIVNACQHPDLFWALKGGGGGSLGVVTRLTLRTRDLPNSFGVVLGSITASSEEAYRQLIAKAVAFYKSTLFNRHWGEQMTLRRRTLDLLMVFQGLEQPQVEKTWEPFLDWVRSDKAYSFSNEIHILTLPARQFWDADFLRQHVAGILVADGRANAPTNRFLWAGDQGQVGWFLHGYQSVWLPEELIEEDRQAALVDALFASSRQWPISLHFNKGLAGAPSEEIAAAANTAMNPSVLKAFALAICAGEGPSVYPGLPIPAPNLDEARKDAATIDQAMGELRRLAPDGGAYLSESNFFQPQWQTAFWGANYPKLYQVKKRYDPTSLFYTWHGVGSEDWSEDGFTRLTG